MAKRKRRASGGGRKPQGEFDQLNSPFSLRMPEDLRKQLEAAADKSGRSASQELLRRLQESFNRDRDKARDPAMRALCFLIAEMANAVAGLTDSEGKPLFDWRTDPFFYRAFKLAVAQLLDTLEPGGKIKPPGSILSAQSEDEKADPIFEVFKSTYETPEERADTAVRTLLSALQQANPYADELKQEDDPHRAKWLRQAYGLKDARRDLELTKRKTTDAKPRRITKSKS
jgi:hypothetical protein